VDPKALENARKDLEGIGQDVSYERDAYKAARGAHALAVLTEWKTFQDLDFEKIFKRMEKPAFVFDGRNLLDPDALARIGFHVVPVGKKERGEFVSRDLSQTLARIFSQDVLNPGGHLFGCVRGHVDRRVGRRSIEG